MAACGAEAEGLRQIYEAMSVAIVCLGIAAFFFVLLMTMHLGPIIEEWLKRKISERSNVKNRRK